MVKYKKMNRMLCVIMAIAATMANLKADDNELVLHCLEKMISKPQLLELAKSRGLSPKSGDNMPKIAAAVAKTGMTLGEVTAHFRGIWKPTDTNALVSALKSGKLRGHDWHGARPSSLHLSLQEKVRESVAGKRSLDDVIVIGADIMRHEYFMVAQHDLVESTIIARYGDVIPPIGSKSITDFVFRKVPVDLKVTVYPEGWKGRAGSLTDDQKREVAAELYRSADTDRMRKQAEGARHSWGLNRMCVLVKDQDRWFTEPEKLLADLMDRLDAAGEPLSVEVNGFKTECYVFEI